MPLLKAQTKIETARQRFALSMDVKADLAEYSRMIESDPDYIVEQALARLFKEKAFVDWKMANPPAETPSDISKPRAGRPRKQVANGTLAKAI